jgi:hypothetical protein
MSSKGIPALRELRNGDRISNGSILAVMASANVFWLVVVSSACGGSRLRWKGQWLEKVQHANKRARVDGIYYTIAEGYETAIVWKDTVLCDVTSQILSKDKDVWFLPQHSADAVSQILAQQPNTYDAEASEQLLQAVVRTPLLHGAPQPPIVLAQETVAAVASKCLQAITMVIYTSFFY